MVLSEGLQCEMAPFSLSSLSDGMAFIYVFISSNFSIHIPASQFCRHLLPAHPPPSLPFHPCAPFTVVLVGGKRAPVVSRGEEIPETCMEGWSSVVYFIGDVKLRGFFS